MTRKLSRSKRKALGIRIKPREGLWLKYQLGLRGLAVKDFAERNGVKPCTVSAIFRGLRSSRRLENAVYQFLGYPSFEAMIAAARGKGGTV
jgi:transcriptional regulator with XRE-family HTH domain